jgi:hypothetical protein
MPQAIDAFCHVLSISRMVGMAAILAATMHVIIMGGGSGNELGCVENLPGVTCTCTLTPGFYFIQGNT